MTTNDFRQELINKAKDNTTFVYTSEPSGDKLTIQFPDGTHNGYSITGKNYPNGISFETLDELILELAGYESLIIRIREEEERATADDGIFDEHLMAMYVTR